MKISYKVNNEEEVIFLKDIKNPKIKKDHQK